MKNKRIILNTLFMVIVLSLRIHKSQCSYRSEDVIISKCCPMDSELTVDKTVDQDGIKTVYNCTDANEIGEGNQTFFGYNLYISDEIQLFELPDLQSCEMFDFDVDGGLISTDGCIDMYNGVLHGLDCSDNKRVEVHKLNKCCAKGRTSCSF